jgi:hypothetical protein
MMALDPRLREHALALVGVVLHSGGVPALA